MLSQSQRATILELHAQGVAKREIARLLNISRQSVRQVLQANSSVVPKIERAEKAMPFRQQILELLPACKGNLVRVHEELVAGGAALSYQALTAFCRREGIGQEPMVPAGRYEFASRRGNAARYFAARSDGGRAQVQSADRLGGAVLLAHAVL